MRLAAAALTICLGALIAWFSLDTDALLGRVIGHRDTEIHRLDGLVIAALHVPAAAALLVRGDGTGRGLLRGFGLGWVAAGALVWTAFTAVGSTHAHWVESALVMAAYVAAAILSLLARREVRHEASSRLAEG